ncbi:hypothetical protein DFJ43DRAFT_1044217 [Lentinula guzmanii]|uniref:TPR-like protein n=1 Tax=Lentinula guzmanii TaxID=2804957 RepID=A0AA38J8P6_9AGAR|nr:hypothetical protein DFJ43DRAFT_1044217 [Lentinula guzmanii]
MSMVSRLSTAEPFSIKNIDHQATFVGSREAGRIPNKDVGMYDEHSIVAAFNSEGNALFKEMDYTAAAAKYTAAINIDEKNAILHSNRAAFSEQATELDPSFIKGFARLARAMDALGQPHQSTIIWEEALKKLARESLTLPERIQQYEYKRSLTAAKHEQLRGRKALEMSIKHNIVRKGEEKDLPWIIAKRLIPVLVAGGDYTSCAWTLGKAYDDLCEGMQELASKAARPASKDTTPRALELLSSSVLTDLRAWHIRNPNYLEKFRRKSIQETEFYHAFAPKLGLEAIKKIVLGRLARAKPEGEAEYRKEWEVMQPSLTATVRYWIMEGFHQGTLFQNPAVGANYLGQTIALIKWGQIQEQRDGLLKEVKGEIFEATYLKRVQVLYMRFVLERFKDLDLGAQQTIFEEADEIVNETTNFQIPRRSDTVFVTSAWYIARGYALTLSYKLSAECFAEDDVNYITALLRCIKSAEYIRSPNVDIQRESLEKIRKAIPKLNYVWKASKEVDEIDKTIKESLKWEETLEGRLKIGYYGQFN